MTVPPREESTTPESASTEEKQTAGDGEEKRLPPGGLAGWPWHLALLLGGIVADQVSKLLSVRYLAPPPVGEGRTIVLIPDWFQLQYAENRGAAFSILDGRTGFLALVSAAAAVGFAIWFTRIPAQERWSRFSLTAVVSGAVGNLIDRVRLGYVVDMFDAYLFGWDYPVFNVADSLIVVGVCILVVRMLQGKI